MQIFRVSPDHKVSAAFLDNRRLSKQVLELYQIIRVCLVEMDIIEGNSRYLSHPIVKHVYNEGESYLHDALYMLHCMDEEHRQRGGKRSAQFREDLAQLEDTVTNYRHLFSTDAIPPFYVFKEEKIYGDQAYTKYLELLYSKWAQDKVPPRCGIKNISREI
ncbi:pyrimidine dimer DNA glycosylase/endonuclease V [Staphylococcus sp. SQ8-PEA]|uniref:Pyrimidine dimer DNA glycosylase/endonuclease V n=1 Tax=Staphylococcus marylandisciuri TaxID=2981529 RepID=A0ABT2QSL9_9STAP|nr:pyrimidine dimer DNA glycosylase/endonuclease V [Staphylococcus marylandisciuri]MCU5746977.1 pyrimidine dimer DNA glycosylase/endonuclease V [Staphylococcus marylandisciuri]